VRWSGAHRARNVRFPPIADLRLSGHDRLMKGDASRLWTRGRVLGAIGSVLLLAYFIVPPIWDLANRPCDLSAICPAPIERGVVPVLGILSLYCLLVGFFISRIVDNGPQDRRTVAGVFLLALCVFGGFMWLMVRAAFW